MTPIRLLPLLAIAALAHAQSIQPAAPAFAARGAFMALSVADLDASVRWYSDKLGLRVVQRPPKFEQSTAVILEGGGLIVELLHRDDGKSLSAVAPGVKENYLVHGIFKTGIIVDDFDATLNMLKARGVEIAIGPFPARGDQRANVIVRDNDGNMIQFFGPR